MEENVIITPDATANEVKMRLDKYLAQKLDNMSRAQIQRLIEGGYVMCEDITITDNSYKVRLGDSFVVTVPAPEEAEPMPEDIPLDIVYEDADIAVINKPAGMTVHPAAGAYHGTLVNALLFHCHDLSGIGGVKRPGIVHRIDRETSGLLVVAKNDTTHRFLSEQFAEHTIERTYYAVVYGVPSPLNGRIEIGRAHV